jgi:spore coat polysaccharide biosynthesis protein SpsF
MNQDGICGHWEDSLPLADKVVAILQARVSSSRLPGKVLLPILGQPMLARQVERVQRARLFGALIVATSIDPSDDPIEALCKERQIVCFRGSLDDVLDRFFRAAEPLQPDHVVRLTGDCPLADPELIDRVITFHIQGGFDYTSNAIEPSYPDGLDVEVFRFACLGQAWKEALLPSQREHVTPFLHTQPGRFRIGSFRGPVDLSHLRWTVDEGKDFELVEKIYGLLYPQHPLFDMNDVLILLEKYPELKDMNSKYVRNEGLRKSLAEDEHFLRKGE